MKMKHRLDPIIDIAESREHTVARELAQVTSVRNTVQNQIDQLKKYREEYKNSALLGKNHSHATFSDIQLFLGRLNSSIRAVEEQLIAIEQRHAELSRQWEKTRSRKRSLEKVVEKHSVMEQARRSRIEQKEQDEVAGRIRHDHPGYLSDG